MTGPGFDPGRNPARLPVELGGHTYLWGQAVALGAERVRNASSVLHRHIDGYLLILAMRQVLLSAEAMNEAIGGDEELTATLARFLADNPQAKNMRDVLSHFDEYQAGTGKLQKTGKVGELMAWLGVGEDSVTVSLASSMMVEVLQASSEAIALADETLSAQHRFLANHQDGT